MVGVSHEIQVHNIAIESAIIKIGVLLGEMKSNEIAA